MSEATSSFLRAQDELAELIGRSVGFRRELARIEARRLVAIHEAVEFAARHAASFVAVRDSASEERELARRAVIAELAVAWRMSEYSMQRLASEAYTLCTSLPATLAALREGDIDAAQARVIVHEVNGLDLPPEVLIAADRELATRARSKTPAELRRAAKRLFEERQLETVAERHARAYAERAVEFEPSHNGMAWLSVYLRAPEALAIRDRLRRAARSARSVAADGRTCAQIEADFARDLLLNGKRRATDGPAASAADHGSQVVEPPNADVAAELANADVAAAVASGDLAAAYASIRPTVHVTVPVLTLLGLGDAPGDLDGYGPIDADTARRLAANAPSFNRLLTHPISGAVLDVDRESYRAPADLRRWVQVRDVTCRFPGCSRPARGCELDHSDDWGADHGKTAHDNLAHLCSNHHHLKHETAWSLNHLPDGVIEWTSLTGARYRTTPAGQLRAPVDQAGAPPDAGDAPTGPAASESQRCRVGRSPHVDREVRNPHDDRGGPPAPDPKLVALAAKLRAERIVPAHGGDFLEPVRPKRRPPATYPPVPAF